MCKFYGQRIVFRGWEQTCLYITREPPEPGRNTIGLFHSWFLPIAWLFVKFTRIHSHWQFWKKKRRILQTCRVGVAGRRGRGYHMLQWKWSRSVVSNSATPWTVAHQVPPSMGFSRHEYWSGLPVPSPGDLPDPGIEPRSPTFQADALTSEPHMLRGYQMP